MGLSENLRYLGQVQMSCVNLWHPTLYDRLPALEAFPMLLWETGAKYWVYKLHLLDVDVEFRPYSTMVVHLSRKQAVVGSIPTAGSNFLFCVGV